MTTIELHTRIKAPLDRVFDLARSIDFHMESASQTQEKAIAGTTSGLIGFGETVTWEGKHLGFTLHHTSKITEFNRPTSFTDIMIKGHFRYFAHQHFFRHEKGQTIMTDLLKYKLPFGILGRLFNSLVLKKHLTKFLEHRNCAIQKSAEISLSGGSLKGVD